MADENEATMAETLSIGDAIKNQIKESVKNFDIVSMLQKIVAVTPEDEESEEIRQKLQGVLQQYNNMGDEQKEQFIAQMKEALATKVSMKMQDQNLNLDGLQDTIKEAIMYRLAFVGIGVSLLIIIFVFFGYKLYKSIKDKELKRENKKKAKQLKKKK